MLISFDESCWQLLARAAAACIVRVQGNADWRTKHIQSLRAYFWRVALSEFPSSTTMSSSSVRVTNYPAIKNAPLVGLYEGNGSFNNIHFGALIIVVPYILKSFIPVVKYGGFKTYLFCVVLFGPVTAVAYWAFNSVYGSRRNEKVTLPGKDIEEYITINDPELKKLYKGKEKIPMQVFHDAYFDGKIDFNGMFQAFSYETRIDVSFLFL